MTLQSFVESYGYVAVFVGCLFEGEAILVAGATAAHFGYLSIWIVAAVGAVSGFIGDQIWFGIGRRYGSRLAMYPRIGRRLDTARRWLAGRSDWIVLLMRFAVGMRTALPIALGAARAIPAGRYAVLNAIGAVLWAAVFSAAGYAFGAAVIALVERAKREAAIVLAAAALTTLVVVLLFRLLAWHARRDPPDGSP